MFKIIEYKCMWFLGRVQTVNLINPCAEKHTDGDKNTCDIVFWIKEICDLIELNDERVITTCA